MRILELFLTLPPLWPQESPTTSLSLICLAWVVQSAALRTLWSRKVWLPSAHTLSYQPEKAMKTT